MILGETSHSGSGGYQGTCTRGVMVLDADGSLDYYFEGLRDIAGMVRGEAGFINLIGGAPRTSYDEHAREPHLVTLPIG